MIINPEYAVVNRKQYKINTDFKVALQCEKVGVDSNIDDKERALTIIYLLFGEEGLNNPQDWEKLLKSAQKFLACGNEKAENDEEPNMDYEQDEKYIKASFMSDYGIDLGKAKLHWWDFFDLMNGLSEDSILSRVRYIRDYDTSEMKDSKDRNKMEKQKRMVALKPKKQKPITAEQQKNLDNFLKLTGMGKEQ